jgi:hypothetical protein
MGIPTSDAYFHSSLNGMPSLLVPNAIIEAGAIFAAASIIIIIIIFSKIF